MRHFLTASLVFLFLSVSIAEGQTPGKLTGTPQDAGGAKAGQQSQPAQSSAEGQPIAEAVRIDQRPRLDGTIDEPLWQQAAAITDFKQREPYEGQPATEKTEVRVLYSKNELYFGITCHDSVGPIATQLRRDVTQELDDYFEIVIDSRHDRRDAYVFQINPLGTQRDALITDEQAGDPEAGENQDGDTGWDGIWTSEARITKDGWTATIAIPFSTLNFMHSEDVVLGLNFKRFIRRKNEEDLWSGWRRTFGVSESHPPNRPASHNSADSARSTPQ